MEREGGKEGEGEKKKSSLLKTEKTGYKGNFAKNNLCFAHFSKLIRYYA